MTAPGTDVTHDEVRRLSAQAAARPGDPVVRARLAVALAPDEASDEAFAQTLALARTCLDLGIVEPAHEAAEILHAHLKDGAHRGGELELQVSLLMADAIIQRDGGAHIAKARALLEAVVAERPDAVGARLRAAALALGLGDAEAARRWIEPVASASTQTRTLYVQTLLTLGAIDEAEAEARSGIQAMGEVLDAGTMREASLLNQLLGLAELTRGRVDAAITALSEGLRLAPDDPVAYYNLALAFEASGSRLAALGVCDAGIELSSADARLLALKARLTPEP